jgi:hypothetical protein
VRVIYYTIFFRFNCREIYIGLLCCADLGKNSEVRGIARVRNLNRKVTLCFFFLEMNRKETLGLWKDFSEKEEDLESACQYIIILHWIHHDLEPWLLCPPCTPSP